jgi:Flp pilus assembly pilin Flp
MQTEQATMISVLKKLAGDLGREEEALSTTEYGVMLALVIIASLAVLAAFRDAILRLFETCAQAFGVTGD